MKKNLYTVVWHELEYLNIKWDSNAVLNFNIFNFILILLLKVQIYSSSSSSHIIKLKNCRSDGLAIVGLFDYLIENRFLFFFSFLCEFS